MPSTQITAAPLALLLVLTACTAGGTANARLRKVEDLTRAGEYERAAEASVRLVDSLDEGSRYYEPALAAQRNVSLASGLDRARTLLLADRNDEALELLLELEEAHPESVHVAAWLDRARTKLGDVWFRRAREQQANEDFIAARDSYQRCLDYDASHPLAEASMVDLDRVVGHRAELADSYYNEGVRQFTREELARASSSFGKVDKFDDENARAVRRRGEVDREIAKRYVKETDGHLKELRFAAAAKALAAAVELDPENQEYAARLAKLRVEAAAAELLEQGEFKLLRGQIDRGEEALRKGLELTEMQTERFEAALEGVADARADKQYQLALDLEYDFRFPQAIEKYEEILESRDFYLDVRARLDTLRGYVADAARLYEEASNAATDEEKLELYRQIDLFWPEYRDVPERIARLSGS